MRLASRRMRKRVALSALGMTRWWSCAPPRTTGTTPRDDAGTAAIRVMLAQTAYGAEITANGGWYLLDQQRRLMARAGSGDRWVIEREGDRVRAAHGSVRTGWVSGP